LVSVVCELLNNFHINNEIFILQFLWKHDPPKAGQFFMIKPLRSSTFLPRPISIFEFSKDKCILKFLISIRGKGTHELSLLQPGENVQLTGPIGNSWEKFLPETGRAALIGGSTGTAPLSALVYEKPDYNFDFYAGFKKGFNDKSMENAFLGAAVNANKLIISAEDGNSAHYGRIVDLLTEPEKFDIIFACGPVAMLKIIKDKCDKKNVACCLSMENIMACGVGACLGCTIKTVNGNRCCCKDGPIFPAGEIIFDE